jgi:hypothetical protein
LKRVKDLLTPWPPGVWVSSYSGLDPTSPNLESAVVTEATAEGHYIHLYISDHGHTYSVAISIPVGEDTAEVSRAISAARGKTLNETGDLVLKQAPNPGPQADG